MVSGITPPLITQFEKYAKWGDHKSDGRMISLLQTDKWLKDVKIIDGRRVTTVDTAACFNRFRLKKLDFPAFIQFLSDLAVSKNLDPDELLAKLTDSCL